MFFSSTIGRIQHVFIRTCGAINQRPATKPLKVLLSIDSKQLTDSSSHAPMNRILSFSHTTVAITIIHPLAEPDAVVYTAVNNLSST